MTCPPPGDLPNPGCTPRSPAPQAGSPPSEPPGKPFFFYEPCILSCLRPVRQVVDFEDFLLCCSFMLWVSSVWGVRFRSRFGFDFVFPLPMDVQLLQYHLLKRLFFLYLLAFGSSKKKKAVDHSTCVWVFCCVPLICVSSPSLVPQSLAYGSNVIIRLEIRFLPLNFSVSKLF